MKVYIKTENFQCRTCGIPHEQISKFERLVVPEGRGVFKYFKDSAGGVHFTKVQEKL